MEIIGTTKISYEIEKILNEAEDYLVLVSPYLKLNDRLKVRLSDSLNRVEKAYLIYRHGSLNFLDKKWLSSYKNLKLFEVKNLHSKIYLNEEQTIITSMNLYEYSQINNHEIGVLLDNSWDDTHFKSTLNEIRIILDSSTDSKNHGFNEIIELSEDYSMRRLFSELYKYSFPNIKSGSDEAYLFVSNAARKIVSFNEDELYQDKTAVLRATELGKERFEKLKTELIKLSKPSN